MVESNPTLRLKTHEMIGSLISIPASGIIAKAMLDQEGPQKFRGIHIRVNRLLRNLGESTVTRKELSPKISLLVATGIVEEVEDRIYQFTENGRKAVVDVYTS